MKKEFSIGEQIGLKIGGFVAIKKKLGEGGQGIVYLVDYNGNDYALKWYTTELSVEFYNNLENNIKTGKPTNAFLWPEMLTERAHDSFGYVMPLRDPEYKDFSDFLLAKVMFGSFSAMINAALSICDGFEKLHRKGYSYQDLNDGNFFIHPLTGDVLICDNDNVTVFGENSGIAGKARWMAPEIVASGVRPDKWTDIFSLAVTLFMIFYNDHPLDGQLSTKFPCMTEAIEKKLYGESPIYVMDPTNKTNMPVRGVHKNVINRWPIYPTFLKDSFAKAFSQEAMLHNRNRRLQEVEWKKILIRLKNSLVKCNKCAKETFLDLSLPASQCINCQSSIPKPSVLKIGSDEIAMWPGVPLYSCHIAGVDDFSTVTGEVIQNKKNPNLMGIRNESDHVWTGLTSNGSLKQISKGDVVPVVKGIKLTFVNGRKGEII